MSLHSHSPQTHMALNLTHPGGVEFQTVSAFLVCVMGGSAGRQTTVHREDKMSKCSAATILNK